MATAIILAVIILYSIWAINKIYKNRKNGGCSCGCSGCAKSKTCKSKK